MNVAIIGAGLGGLSAAIRLARAGVRVCVYEQRQTVGGKVSELRLGESGQSWRFDIGPSLLTLPGVFDDLFASAGRKREDYLSFVPLDPITRHWFADNTRIDSTSRRAVLNEQLVRKGLAKQGELDRFLDHCEHIWMATHKLFMETGIHEPGELVRCRDLWSRMLRYNRLDVLRTMAAANRTFFSDERAQQMFNRSATYNFSNPYRTPATLNVISHVEYSMGVWAVRGGIIRIAAALEQLARELGVEFRLGEPVSRILTDRRSRVRGVASERGTELFDAVVSNANVLSTYTDLLGKRDSRPARRYRSLPMSSGALVFLWAMKRGDSRTHLHNIFFSGDYRREFEEIEAGVCPADPTIYVNIGSRVDPDDAPASGENWFVFVNAPGDRGQDWDRECSRVRSVVLRRLSCVLDRDISDDIVFEKVLDPPAFASLYGDPGGSLGGSSHNSKLSAFLRHPNRSRHHPGLYFCGGSTHPGPGMPMVLHSGSIAADLLMKREGLA